MRYRLGRYPVTTLLAIRRQRKLRKQQARRGAASLASRCWSCHGLVFHRKGRKNEA